LRKQDLKIRLGCVRRIPPEPVRKILRVRGRKTRLEPVRKILRVRGLKILREHGQKRLREHGRKTRPARSKA
jgi:hypothetical protein